MDVRAISTEELMARIAFVFQDVYLFDGGRIVAEGSHDQLLRDDGRYAEFWTASLAPAAGG